MKIKVCYRHNKALIEGNWIVGKGYDITDIFTNVSFEPKPCPDCKEDPAPINNVIEMLPDFHVRYCQFHGKIHGPTGKWYHVYGKLPAGKVRDRIQSGCKQKVILHPVNCYVCLGGIDQQNREQDFRDGKSH